MPFQGLWSWKEAENVISEYLKSAKYFKVNKPLKCALSKIAVFLTQLHYFGHTDWKFWVLYTKPGFYRMLVMAFRYLLGQQLNIAPWQCLFLFTGPSWGGWLGQAHLKIAGWYPSSQRFPKLLGYYCLFGYSPFSNLLATLQQQLLTLPETCAGKGSSGNGGPESSEEQVATCRTVISGLRDTFWSYWRCRIQVVKSVQDHNHS